MPNTIAKNKRAFFDYEIDEKFEAGIVLLGHEVKSIKTGHISLKGSYVVPKYPTKLSKSPEIWLIGAKVPKYAKASNVGDFTPDRSRKLLLKKSEISRIIGLSKQKNLTMIPLSVYTKKGRIKVEFAIAHSKKKHDKRQSIKEKEDKRKMERAMRQKQ